MSSYKARGSARIRETPLGTPAASAIWSLMDLGIGERPSEPATATISNEMLEAEYERGYLAGKAEGLALGEATGLATAEAQFATCRTVAETAVRELEAASTLAPATLEDNVAALAVIVARQIVEREVVSDPTIVGAIVRRALTEFPLAQAVRIRVHPLDLSALSTATVGANAAPITGTRDASWMADARIVRGGVLVEGTDRIVDGRVDIALERAYRRMAGLDAT